MCLRSLDWRRFVCSTFVWQSIYFRIEERSDAELMWCMHHTHHLHSTANSMEPGHLLAQSSLDSSDFNSLSLNCSQQFFQRKEGSDSPTTDPASQFSKHDKCKYLLVSSVNGRRLDVAQSYKVEYTEFRIRPSGKWKIICCNCTAYLSRQSQSIENRRVAGRTHSSEQLIVRRRRPLKQLEPCLSSDKCFRHSIWQFASLSYP